MAEKIKIVEMDLGIDGLISKGAKAKEVVLGISNQLTKLRKENKANVAESEILNKELKELESQGKGTSSVARQYKDRIEELNGLQKLNIRETTKLDAKLKTARKSYNAQIKVINAFNEKTFNSLDIIKETDGSIDQLDAALTNNRNIYKKLTKEQQDNEEIGGKLLELIQDQDEEYKRLQNSIGNTYVEVGNYKDAILEAAMGTTIFTKAKANVMAVIGPFMPILKRVGADLKTIYQGYLNAAAGTKGYNSVVKATIIISNLFTNTLKLLRVALMSTGILAIVVAVASLFAWFTKTQKGADKLAQVFAGVGAAIDALIDTFARIGGAIWGFITGQKSLSEAWDEGTSALAGMTDEMAREYRMAIKLEKKLQQLEKAEILLDIQRAASKRTLKQLNLIAEDTTKTIEERIDALERSAKIEEDLLTRTIKLGEDRLANKLGELELTEKGRKTIERFRKGALSADEALASLGLSESLVEDLEEFRDLFVDVENKQAELFEIQTTRQNKLNTLINEQKRLQQQAIRDAIALYKEQTQAAIKEMEVQLKIYLEKQGVRAKSLEDEILITEKAAAKELEILKAKLKAKEITQSEYDLEFLKLQNKLNEQYNKLIDDTYKRDFQTFLQNHQSKLDANKYFNEQLYQQELERINKIAAAEKESYKKRFEAGTISETEYNDEINRINDDNRIIQEELKIQRETAEAEKKAIDLENKRIIEQENLENEHQRQLFRLNLMYQEELKSAEKTGADTKIITQKYAIAKQKIDEGAVDAKLSANASAFGEIAGFLGEETALGKAAALAQAAINIQQGVTKALASKGFAGIAQGVIVAAKGAVSVAKIAGVNTSFDKGGQVKIPSGTGGVISGRNIPTQRGGDNILTRIAGTNQLATVKDKEVILNETQQALAGGPEFFKSIGVPGFNTGGRFVSSPVAQTISTFRTSTTKVIDEQRLAEMIGEYVGEANKKLPPQQLDLIAMGQKQNEIDNVISGANG